MPTVTIRNVPEGVLRRLKALARINHRSMEEELRRLIASKVVDRLSALRQIDESVMKQRRRPKREEVDSWLRASRP